MKTIKIEIIDGKFGRVKWKGEKNYPHTPERVEVDGWKCIVEKNGDIFCEYVAFDGNRHYIFSYVQFHLFNWKKYYVFLDQYFRL